MLSSFVLKWNGAEYYMLALFFPCNLLDLLNGRKSHVGPDDKCEYLLRLPLRDVLLLSTGAEGGSSDDELPGTHRNT